MDVFSYCVSDSIYIAFQIFAIRKVLGRTCSVVRRTQLLVRLLILKTHHSGQGHPCFRLVKRT